MQYCYEESKYQMVKMVNDHGDWNQFYANQLSATTTTKIANGISIHSIEIDYKLIEFPPPLHD